MARSGRFVEPGGVAFLCSQPNVEAIPEAKKYVNLLILQWVTKVRCNPQRSGFDRS